MRFLKDFENLFNSEKLSFSNVVFSTSSLQVTRKHYLNKIGSCVQVEVEKSTSSVYPLSPVNTISVFWATVATEKRPRKQKICHNTVSPALFKGDV